MTTSKDNKINSKKDNLKTIKKENKEVLIKKILLKKLHKRIK